MSGDRSTTASLRRDHAPRRRGAWARSSASLAARGLFVGFVLLLGLGVAGPGAAQEARVEIASAPYYQGQPIELHVIAEQFEEDPAPQVEFDPEPGVALRLQGVSPSSSTSITIVNGQISRVHQVSFTYRYELTSARVGALRIPEFRVRQGAVVRTTRPFSIEVAAVPSSDEFGIAVVLPQGPIFVGQKVPVAIEFRIDQEAASQILDYRVQVPLFDVPGLRFIDAAPAGADSQLQIVTAAGPMQLPAKSEERTIGGRPSLVLRAERTLIAQKPGRIEVDAPTVAVERGTRFRQDFFGGRRAVQTQRTVSAGRALRLEVAELPREGRPASFAGAVGSDFSLEVQADRSVVQLGEPIELDFRVRGHGDLSSAGLPPLDAPGLFDPARFRLPEEAPAGILDEDGKHFRVTVRVLDANVREIPSLEYAWFDSETRRFETVRSQPIALSVSAAQVVGADAVTSAPGAGGADASGGGALAEDEAAAIKGASAGRGDAAGGASTAEGRGGPGGGPARSSSLAESAANLAVERDPDVLLQGVRANRGVGIATVSLYLVGLALVGLGFVDRRRRAVDPRLRARIDALQRAKQAVESALAHGSDGPGALGRALREWIAASPEEASAEVDALLAECDALRFAPGAGGGAGGAAGGLPEPLASRARELIDDRLAAATAAASASASNSSRARLVALACVLGAASLSTAIGLASLVAFAAIASPATAVEPDARARLERTVADYEAAQAESDRDARIAGFQRAEQGFAALIEEGARSPALYTNLGNAALQAGRVGQAVLAYRRALTLDPKMATARQNLAHVRAQLPAWVPRPGDAETDPALYAYRRVAAPTRALAAAGCFAGATLALFLAGRRREGAWRGLVIALGVGWLALLASVVVDGRGAAGQAGVLTAEETAARSSDSALAALAFPEPLPQGVEIEQLELRGDFARIRLANGRDVWVRDTSVSLIDD
ncbi:MAG: BatD family protein [Deltaproteobacteria bacterium]|nr:BatD family protein [Deltaproteobacteria bacterium]